MINLPVKYINLDRSPDRRQFMEKQFEIFGIKSTRIPAIDGKKITNLHVDTVDGVSFINNYKDLTKYEIACTLSHLKAIKSAYDEGLDQALIMEDDCTFFLLPYWGLALSEIIEKAPSDWRILQLVTLQENCHEMTNKFLPYDEKNPCWSNAAYVINKQGMKEVLDICGNNFITLGIQNNKDLFPTKGVADEYIYQCAKSYYYTTPLFLIADDILQSTIHRDHEEGHIKATKSIISAYNNFNTDQEIKTEKQFKFAKVLSDMDNYLSSLNITYTLQCGTLLGAYREGKFIEHDPDIDLGIMASDYNEKLKHGNNDFELLHTYGEPCTGGELTYKHRETDIRVDIFLIYKEGNSMWYPSFTGHCDKSKLKMCRWKIPNFTVGKIDFLNRQYNVPMPIEKVLETHYGPNWNIPAKYDYYEGINRGLYRGLIQDDFKPEDRQNLKEDKKKYDLWPRKIRSIKKPIIWMYWQNKDANSKRPPYLNLCLQSVYKHCKEKFHIIVLDDDLIPVVSRTIHPSFTNITPLAMRTDYIRFSIVAEYGGVWLDFDTVVLSDIYFMIKDLDRYNFVAFANEHQADISTRIFAGNPNNRVCTYLKYLFEHHDKLSSWISSPTEIKWQAPTEMAIEYMKNMLTLYPNEYKTYNMENKISIKSL